MLFATQFIKIIKKLYPNSGLRAFLKGNLKIATTQVFSFLQKEYHQFFLNL